MKPSHFLKKVKLYEPLRWIADFLMNLESSSSEKLKSLIFRKAFNRRQRGRSYYGFGPNVLVVMTEGGIGNSIEATPLVQAIRALWRRAVITIVPLSGDLFDNWCVPDYVTGSAEDIKGKVFDHTFFPYSFLNDIDRWKQICQLGEIHCPRVRFKKYFLKPEREYMVDMLRRLGYKGTPPPLYVSVKKPNLEIADSDFRVCLVPGAKNVPKWKHKRWPYFNELAEKMSVKYPDVQICIIGTKDDPFDGQALADLAITDLRDRLTLAETAWVLKNSHLAVGNDCGPMHIAYAVQTPSIVIFGPTCEIKNAPAGKGLTLSTDLPCRPCQYAEAMETCPDPRCMKELGADIVMNKVEQILSRTYKE